MSRAVVVPTFNPSTLGAEASGSLEFDQHGLQSKCQDYTEKNPVLRKEGKKQREENLINLLRNGKVVAASLAQPGNAGTSNS